MVKSFLFLFYTDPDEREVEKQEERVERDEEEEMKDFGAEKESDDV